MSVEIGSLSKSISAARKKNHDDSQRVKKRKRAAVAEPESPSARKKHRSEQHSPVRTASAIPSKTSDKNSSPPFCQETSSLYLPLPPVAQSNPLQGLCAEHLSPLILTYYPPLRGVVLSYHHPRLSTTPDQVPATSDEPALAHIIDEYAAPHVWVTADFILFRPRRGGVLEGWINLQSEGNIGLVCWNFFNASIERQRLPKEWRWNAGGLNAKKSMVKLKGKERADPPDVDEAEDLSHGNEVNGMQGYFETGDGRRVEGLISFTVRDVETSRSSGGDNGFLSIEGTLLGESEERDLRASEVRNEISSRRKQQRNGNEIPYAMSGALRSEDESNPDSETLKKSKLRMLWTIGTISAPYAAAGAEPSISQLLDQINDIIPLESEDWGLEDYAVEVGEFECLHFAKASQILKEDDIVCIRPLSTSDLRFRKISGRHQISADGKHLVDGIAFGRPFLRRAERPVIRIPPRKRRRLEYDQDDEAEDNHSQRQIVVHAGFENEDISSAQSGYTEDRALPPDDEEDLDAELGDIRDDANVVNGGDDQDSSSVWVSSVATDALSSQSNTIERRRPLRARGLGLRASGLTKDEIRIPSHNVHETATATMSSNSGSAHELRTPARTKRKEVTPISSSKSVRFEDVEQATPATIRLESSEDSDDDDFQPPDGSEGETDGSDKENATPRSRVKTNIQKSAILSESSSSSDSESDETSSSGSSSSASSSSESDEEISHRPKNAENGCHSEVSSSETSDTSGSPDSEETSTKRQRSTSEQATPAPIVKGQVQNLRPIQQSKQGIQPKPVPPGQGRRSTQKRNKRKQDRRKLIRLQEAGILPAWATTPYMRSTHASLTNASQKDSSANGAIHLDESTQEKSAPDESEDDFKARRQALLDGISSGGINAEADLGSMGPSAVTRTEDESDARSAAVAEPASNPTEKTLIDTNLGPETGGERTVLVDDEEGKTAELHNSSQKPRFRLDIDSSRRLVFGALGQRTPKSKEDEIALQAKLMQQAQTPQKLPVQRPSLVEPENVPSPPEESVNWQDKIELTAVECCHDGIELSTPPFPFVQRWDPQQKRGYPGQKKTSLQSDRKRKRKRAEKNPLKFWGNDAHPRRRENFATFLRNHSRDDDTTTAMETQPIINHHEADENSVAADEQLLRETKEASKSTTEEPDMKEALPGLPEDVSVCPNLEQTACVAGAIVAFKQLDMSSETNWQPRISDYRTALIDNVLEDGTLCMRIALRDKPQGRKQYDPDTGERVYSKFEMPGYNEDDEDETEEDGGILDLRFAELIDPKLVRAAETDSEATVTVGNGDGRPDVAETEVTDEDPSPVRTSDVIQHSTEEPRNLDIVSEQVRKEIHELIKDAGWHSSVRSNGSSRPDLRDTSHAKQDDGTSGHSRNPQSTGAISPRFNGFSSSPPAEEFQEMDEEQIIYPTLRNLSSPPPKANGIRNTIMAADSSSQMDGEAIQAISADFGQELDEQIPPSYQLNQQQSPPAPGSASASSSSSAAFDEPDRQPSSFPPHPSSPLTNSLNSTIPDSQPPPPNHPGPKTTATISATNSSEDDLPSLETVFTSFSSQRRSNSVKSEPRSSSPSSSSDADHKNALLRTLPLHSKNTRNGNFLPPNEASDNKEGHLLSYSSSAPARLTKSQPNKSSKSKAKRRSRLNRYDPAPRSSQDWIGTQVVDLTVSSSGSDPIVGEEKEEDGDGGEGESELPKGPGWVRKKTKKTVGGVVSGRGKVGGR
ncbi:MAG: hypothetical protein Q9220_002506 [cf. Caloplaca sp. 1 TL-2023]